MKQVPSVSSQPLLSEKVHSSIKMETTVLKEMQVEVITMLNSLTKDKFLSVFEFLHVAEPEKIVSKSCMSLISHVLQHLEDITELEDGGMSELLRLRDQIIELNIFTESETTAHSETTETTEKDKLQRGVRGAKKSNETKTK